MPVVVVLADGEAAWDGAIRCAHERLAEGSIVGLVLAGPDSNAGCAEVDLPLRFRVELAPWSAAAVRVWLRTRLRGEPSTSLVEHIQNLSRGLPARAECVLARMTDSGALSRSGDEWTASRSATEPTPAQRPLPDPPTELLGRGPETDLVIGLLSAERLLTLTGPGGIGKTRLAVAVATSAAYRYTHGVVFVSLAEATTASHVESAVAEALQLAETGDRSLHETVTEYLRSRQLLLVLDNFEQVQQAAVLVADWLVAAPELTILVTSRERLRLSAERVYRLSGLTLPALDMLPALPDLIPSAIARSAALTLLQARARRIDYDFTLTLANLPAAAEICHRLDGIPLAIELAAPHLDSMSTQELLGRLRGRLDLLAEGPYDSPLRQQTLRAAISWSYDLLDTVDRTLLTALGVFAGGCRIEALSTVCPGPRLSDRLAGLVEKSLLQTSTDPDGATRFAMLETIRTFAAEQLAAAADSNLIHTRHATYYAMFAESCLSKLLGPEQPAVLDLIGTEQHNLRAALAWTTERADYELAARTIIGVWRVWTLRGNVTEGREWLGRVLEAHDRLPLELVARLHYGAGVMALDQGDVSAALAHTQEAVRCFGVVGESIPKAEGLRVLGRIHAIAGDYEQTRNTLEESLRLGRAEGHVTTIGGALNALGEQAIRLGEFDEGRALMTESLEIFRANGGTLAILSCLASLGEVLMFQADTVGARPLLEESLALSREIGDICSEAWALHHLGVLTQIEGDLPAATRLFMAALTLRHEVQEQTTIADSLEALAGVSIETDPVRATRLYAAAQRVRDDHHLARAPVWQQPWERNMRRLHEAVEDGPRHTAWIAGETAALDDIVADALAAGARALSTESGGRLRESTR